MEKVVSSVPYDELNDSLVVSRVVKGVKTQVVIDNILKAKVSKEQLLGDVIAHQSNEIKRLQDIIITLNHRVDAQADQLRLLLSASSSLSESVKLINDKLSLEGRI